MRIGGLPIKAGSGRTSFLLCCSVLPPETFFGFCFPIQSVSGPYPPDDEMNPVVFFFQRPRLAIGPFDQSSLGFHLFARPLDFPAPSRGFNSFASVSKLKSEEFERFGSPGGSLFFFCPLERPLFVTI